jgi:MATE family multidrug resistance protein
MAQVEKHVSHRPLRPDYSRAHEAKSLRSEIGYTLRLGGPLALGELGWMSTYIVDALMIGRLANSPLAISASSLGNTIFYAIVFCAIYLMNGLETLIAQAYGQGDTSEGVILLAQSFWIVVVGTPLVMLSTLAALPLLPHLGTPPEIVAETARYVKPLVWSTAPLMAYMALRKFLQSVDRVLLITVSLVTASFVNWLGDYAFLFGHFGFKPMGVAGSAWGTLVVRFWMLGLLAVGTCLAVRQQGQQLTWSMLRPDGRRLKLLLGIGWPSGLQTLTELGVSTYTSILCARLGTILLAAHQVVLDLNAFVYQVPLGLAYATVTRVGQSAGRNSLPEVRRATNASLAYLGRTVHQQRRGRACSCTHLHAMRVRSARRHDVCAPGFGADRFRGHAHTHGRKPCVELGNWHAAGLRVGLSLWPGAEGPMAGPGCGLGRHGHYDSRSVAIQAPQ